MSEYEPHILSSQDVQDFIQAPEEEIDTFAIMAGSIVGEYKTFSSLSLEVQELIFTHLHTYAYLAFQSFDNRWNQTKSDIGRWEKARSEIDGIFLSDPTLTSAKEIMPYVDDDKARKSIKSKIGQAHNTIFEMFLHRVITLDQLEELKSHDASKYRTYGRTEVKGGKQYHSRKRYSR